MCKSQGEYLFENKCWVHFGGHLSLSHLFPPNKSKRREKKQTKSIRREEKRRSLEKEENTERRKEKLGADSNLCYIPFPNWEKPQGQLWKTTWSTPYKSTCTSHVYNGFVRVNPYVRCEFIRKKDSYWQRYEKKYAQINQHNVAWGNRGWSSGPLGFLPMANHSKIGSKLAWIRIYIGVLVFFGFNAWNLSQIL